MSLRSHHINRIEPLEERRQYTYDCLRRRQLPLDPWELFAQWLHQAFASKIIDATAMSLASVDATGQPYQRLVLLRAYDHQGLVFYTHLKSRKVVQLQANARVSLLFPWQAMDRQVMALGECEPLARERVEHYFQSRPRQSQLAAWASEQSMPIPSKAYLLERFNAYERQFSDKTVPAPVEWGGFRVCVNTFEFWQGGIDRLHDRFLYQRSGQQWQISRLAP